MAQTKPVIEIVDVVASATIEQSLDLNDITEKFPDSADTIPYWKPLSETLDGYSNHKETKSGGDMGLLPRLRMKMDRNQIKYVGKEVANLDASNILGVSED
jgi:hypothetical protein